MRCLVVVAIASGCGGGSGGTDGGPHWVFTANVTAALSEASGPVDLAAGAGVTGGPTGSFSIGGKSVGAPCDHTVGIYVPAPLAAQTYQLGAMTGSASDSFAVYTDCRLGGYYLHTADTNPGTLTVTRTDASCALPPCIEATFGFSVGEPVPNGETFYDQINDGHVSNY